MSVLLVLNKGGTLSTAVLRLVQDEVVPDETPALHLAQGDEAVDNKQSSLKALGVPLKFIVVLSVVSAAGIPLSPLLLKTSPLLLVALNPRLAFLVFCAGKVPMWQFILVGTLRLCVADPFHYMIGNRIDSWLFAQPKKELKRKKPLKWLRKLLKWVHKHPSGKKIVVIGVLLRPNWYMLQLAGSLKAHPVAVGAASVLSTVVYLAAIAQTSAALGVFQ